MARPTNKSNSPREDSLKLYDAPKGAIAPPDTAVLQAEIDGQAYMMQCAREQADLETLDKTERAVGEIAEALASAGAGALSSWRVGAQRRPAGGAINLIIGSAAKFAALLPHESRSTRVAIRAAKTLFHVQIGLIVGDALGKSK